MELYILYLLYHSNSRRLKMARSLEEHPVSVSLCSSAQPWSNSSLSLTQEYLQDVCKKVKQHNMCYFSGPGQKRIGGYE